MSILSTVPKGAAVEGINPNLLRNWYFVGGGTGRGVFPVNSRGTTTYTNNGYIIDGWAVNSGNTITLSSSGMNVQGTATYTNINQYVDSPTSFSNQTLTLSILISSASSLPYVLVYSDSSTEIFRERIQNVGLYTKTFTTNSTGVYRISLNSLAYSVNYTIQAIKLELGDQQTLAHQENGVWVLNEIPDYEYELYRCITSTADSNDTYANKTLATQDEIAIEAINVTPNANVDTSILAFYNSSYRIGRQIFINVAFSPAIARIQANSFCSIPSAFCPSQNTPIFANVVMVRTATSKTWPAIATVYSSGYIGFPNQGGYDETNNLTNNSLIYIQGTYHI